MPWVIHENPAGPYISGRVSGCDDPPGIVNSGRQEDDDAGDVKNKDGGKENQHDDCVLGGCLSLQV